MQKTDVIVDLQFGSTGKGLIAGYMAKRGEYDLIVSANMPNAGHTYINGDGRKWVHKVLPNGVVSPTATTIGIGPGAVFDMSQLAQEMDDSADLMADKVLMIHESAVVLKPEHISGEKRALNSISSTMQGSAAAMVEKIMRNPNRNILAKTSLIGTRFGPLVVSAKQWAERVKNADSILLEGAQGFSLGINSGFWPYCTSRDCSPARFMSDCAIPASYLRKIIGTARVHPIRVGNTPGGTSGPGYHDQTEISWEKLKVEPETTTVTRRQRRVFTFSQEQIAQAIMAFQPNDIFLNFCNYVEQDTKRAVKTIEAEIEKHGPMNCWIKYLGYGPTDNDVKRRGE